MEATFEATQRQKEPFQAREVEKRKEVQAQEVEASLTPNLQKSWISFGLNSFFNLVPPLLKVENEENEKEILDSKLLFPTFSQTPSWLENVKLIECGWSFSVCITRKGELVFWGTNENIEALNFISKSMLRLARFIEPQSKFTLASCGRSHILAIDGTGKLWSCGSNSFGECGQGNFSKSISLLSLVKGEFEKQKVIQCSAGEYHSLVVLENGKVFGFGNGSLGQLGTGLKQNYSSPICVKFPLETKIVSISCGWSHSLAISNKGSVFSFGWGSYLQLGNGKRDDCLIPTLIEHLDSQVIVQTSCGGWHSIFLSEKGKVFSCGYGEFGCLGHGDLMSVDFPQVIHSLLNTKIIRISCGSRHTCLLSDKQEIFTFGIGYATGSGDFRQIRSHPFKLETKNLSISNLSSKKWGTFVW